MGWRVKLFVAITVFVLISTLIGMGYLRTQLEKAYTTKVDVGTHLGEVRRLKEVLTMAARVGVAKRDISYERLHAETLSNLDRSLTAVFAIAHEAGAFELFRAAEAAHHELNGIERQAFDMVRRNQQPQAMALLESPYYTDQKRLYLGQIEALLARINQAQSDRQQSIDQMLLVMTLGLVFSAGALLFFIARTLAAAAAAERERARLETMRLVMSSVMDAYNNFLNSMVYFRYRAEQSQALNEEELKMIDRAIESARDRLLEIAETRELNERDLGGIKIVASKQGRKAA